MRIGVQLLMLHVASAMIFDHTLQKRIGPDNITAEHEFMKKMAGVTNEMASEGISFILRSAKNKTTDILSTMTEDQFYTIQIIRALTAGDAATTKLLYQLPFSNSSTDNSDWIDCNFEFHKDTVYMMAKTASQLNEVPKSVGKVLLPLMERDGVLKKAAENGDNPLVGWLITNGLNLKAVGAEAVEVAWSRNHVDTVSLLLETPAIKDLDSFEIGVNATSTQGKTLLHFAAEDGLLHFAKKLVDSGAVVDAKDKYFLTPFYYAMERRDKEMARLLLTLGARVFTKTPSGDTLLHLAVIQNSPSAVMNYLKFGYDIDVKNDEELTPLYLAFETGNDAIAKILLKAGADPNTKTRSGNALLHIAAKRRNLPTVKYLVKYGAEINIRNQEGVTPLYSAVEVGSREVANYLVSRGSLLLDPESRDTLLHLAARKGHIKALETLVSSYLPIDSVNRRGVPPLYTAASAARLAAVELLIARGADLYMTLSDGRRLLHVAAADGDVVVMQALLYVGTFVDLKDSDGMTPLCRAIQADNIVSVAFLIEKGANTNFRTTNEDSLLHLAAGANSHESITLLVEHGIQVDSENKQNETPLYIAAQRNNITIANLLISLGSNKNYVTLSGNSLVHLAAHRGHLDALKCFADVGADMNILNKNGITPIYMAINNSQVEAAEFLLKSDVDLYFSYANEDTLLHIAVRNADKRVIIFLIDIGMHIDYEGSNGLRPIDVALQNELCDIAKLLIENGANINGRNMNHQTVLHSATIGDCVGFIEENNHQLDDIDPKDRNLQTPLHLAAILGRNNIFKTLYMLGANVNAKDHNEDQPLDIILFDKYWGVVQKLLADKSNGILVIEIWDIERGRVDILDYILMHMDTEHSIFLSEMRNSDGDTPLSVALKNNHLNIVYNLLKYKMDVSWKDERNRTLLHFAVMHGQESIVKILLEHGIDGNARDSNGDTGLTIAIKNEHWNLVYNLLKYGADVSWADERNRTLLHWASLIGDYRLIEYMLDTKSTNVNSVDYNLQTPLHLSAIKNDPRSVDLLLQHGADQKATDIHARSPVNLAILHSSWDVIGRWYNYYYHSMLVISDIDTKWVDSSGRTLLHIVAASNNVGVVGQLVERGAHKDAMDYQNLTPVMVAALNNSWDAVKFLLDKQVDVEWKDDANRTLCHLAALAGRTEIVTYLIENRNVDINETDIHLQTPLHLAASKDHTDVVTLLLANGADRNALDHYQRTPLDLAAFNDCAGAVILLLSDEDKISWTDSKNRTALHFAAMNGNELVLSNIVQNKSTNVNSLDNNHRTPLDILVEKNFTCLAFRYSDSIWRDGNGRTFLHLAALNNWTTIFLSECQPYRDEYQAMQRYMNNEEGKDKIWEKWDYDAVDDDLRTPLHQCALNGNNEFLKLLLLRIAKPNAKDRNGHTALHLAAGSGRKSVVQLLFEHELHLHPGKRYGNRELKVVSPVRFKVKINARDLQGRTPLQMALENSHKETAALLRQYGGKI